MNRREFIQLLLQGAAVAGTGAYFGSAQASARALYDLDAFGSARILHMTDCHAQLQPIYFREPNVNIGLGEALGRWPHVVGRNLLKELGDISARDAHAFTYLDFVQAAEKFGRVGGFAHLKTLVDQLRGEVPDGSSLLLDGGDTWQGSGTALWTRGRDMVEATNLLGVDIMTGHWEFTYHEDEILENIEAFNGEFLAHNTYATEDALFDGVPVYNEDTGHVFKPYTIREMKGRRVAVIGQAFPYTPIANPKRFIPNWTFGIRDEELSQLVETVRADEKPDAVILLSHNGMDVDLKLASRVSGIDFILGGHTHDGMPRPIEVENSGGTTVVTNAGSNGKFVAVLDLEFGNSGVSAYRYKLLPVFSELLAPNATMQAHIDAVRAPYREVLDEELAVADSLLYRRGNFNGSFDQLIVDAMRQELDAQIALSPGFRWGTTVMPGEAITMDRLLDQTCMTYPETYVREMSGGELRNILESVADNLFNADPYYQQGGDMVRTGGFNYRLDPLAAMGSRVSDMTLANGKRMQDNGSYKVAGWATVGSQSTGDPVWEVVARYLRAQKTVRIERLESPALKNVSSNPGLADYRGTLG
ncbi:thiosulfohydrolase SoxB [Congregibacter sp.]|uniref:thiosulfohydrolase SoxB n=1 Tax=Congregibacter sp. TaxID=2744308 RepID=UPI003F6B9A2F